MQRHLGTGRWGNRWIATCGGADGHWNILKPDDKAAGDLRDCGSQPVRSTRPATGIPPTGLTVTDSWAATAGPDGTVAADRTVPEPDSLGG